MSDLLLMAAIGGLLYWKCPDLKAWARGALRPRAGKPRGSFRSPAATVRLLKRDLASLAGDVTNALPLGRHKRRISPPTA
ncbi:MAG: hypothetical protein J4G03_04225 [Gemmatimonadetes bacterium]|nr:hypothetical protein [Gemmatimonadota bacterium]